MSKTKTIAAFSGIALGLMYLTSAVSAQEAGSCAISDGKVVCADTAQDRKAVFEAMASPSSLQYFRNLLVQPGFSLDTNRREAYRRSLEQNRRAMHRYARAQFRSFRRRRIDSETYEKIREQYGDAVATYKAALNIYRSTIWHSKTPPRVDG